VLPVRGELALSRARAIRALSLGGLLMLVLPSLAMGGTCAAGTHSAGMISTPGIAPAIGSTWTISIGRISSSLGCAAAAQSCAGPYPRHIAAYFGAGSRQLSFIEAGIAQSGSGKQRPQFFIEVFVRGEQKRVELFGAPRTGANYLVRLTHLGAARWNAAVGGRSLRFAFPNELSQVMGMVDAFQASAGVCPAFNFAFSGFAHSSPPMILFDRTHVPTDGPFYVHHYTGSSWTVSGG
jgi:hypothetical protein